MGVLSGIPLKQQVYAGAGKGWDRGAHSKTCKKRKVLDGKGVSKADKCFHWFYRSEEKERKGRKGKSNLNNPKSIRVVFLKSKHWPPSHSCSLLKLNVFVTLMVRRPKAAFMYF